MSKSTRCSVCENPFTIVKNPRKKYCSDACRSKAYRKRSGRVKSANITTYEDNIISKIDNLEIRINRLTNLLEIESLRSKSLETLLTYYVLLSSSHTSYDLSYDSTKKIKSYLKKYVNSFNKKT